MTQLVTHENKETDFQVDGLWVLRSRGPLGFIQTRLGRLHNNMTQRARASGCYQREGGYYQGVTIHPDFVDSQKFCDWVVQQPGWGLGYTLDKDLLVPGNREYGPDACCFLPGRINTAIARFKKNSVHPNLREGRVKQLADEFRATISPLAYEALLKLEGVLVFF